MRAGKSSNQSRASRPAHQRAATCFPSVFIVLIHYICFSRLALRGGSKTLPSIEDFPRIILWIARLDICFPRLPSFSSINVFSSHLFFAYQNAFSRRSRHAWRRRPSAVIVLEFFNHAMRSTQPLSS
jgi:hypothetical protein